jgi:hypothetical protein
MDIDLAKFKEKQTQLLLFLVIVRALFKLRN